MLRRVVAGVLWCALVVACTNSDEPDGPPGLDRIDGPAQVDPSFDPFATISPTTTDADG